jgi:hypothetical protein
MGGGCSRTYYPALWRSSPPPIIRSTSVEDSINNFYLGADYSHIRGDYDKEFADLFRVNYLHSKKTKFTTTNFEAFAYGGNYRVWGNDNMYINSHIDGNKSFFGLGGYGNLALSFTSSAVRFGLGATLMLNTEFGEYYAFRTTSKYISHEGGCSPCNSLYILFSSCRQVIKQPSAYSATSDCPVLSLPLLPSTIKAMYSGSIICHTLITVSLHPSIFEYRSE